MVSLAFLAMSPMLPMYCSASRWTIAWTTTTADRTGPTTQARRGKRQTTIKSERSEKDTRRQEARRSFLGVARPPQRARAISCPTDKNNRRRRAFWPPGASSDSEMVRRPAATPSARIFSASAKALALMSSASVWARASISSRSPSARDVIDYEFDSNSYLSYSNF